MVSLPCQPVARRERTHRQVVRHQHGHRGPEAGRGGGQAGLRQLRRRPTVEQDGQLHHRPGGRRPQLVRGGVPHLRVRSRKQGHGAEDSGHHPPRRPALVRVRDRARHDRRERQFRFPDCDRPRRGEARARRRPCHRAGCRAAHVRRRASGRDREHGGRGGPEHGALRTCPCGASLDTERVDRLDRP